MKNIEALFRKSNWRAENGLPRRVVFCQRCVISNQRPMSTVEFRNQNKTKDTINIDANGICDACRYAESKASIDWDSRNEQLLRILEKYRKTDGSYDCIVPSSGGKDSSFTAHILKTKYDMNPLTVTWRPNMFTDVGRRNFESLCDVGGIDNLLFSPNGALHRSLTRLAFQNLCHPFQPFIHGQKVIGPKIADKFDIPLVIYGENQAEYGNRITDNNSFLMTNNFFTAEDSKSLFFGGCSLSDILKETNFKYKDFSAYTPLSSSEVTKKNIKMLYLGYFEKWDPQNCYYYSAKNTGFMPADFRSDGTFSRYTEIDDKIVPFHFYTTLIKFGIGRATYDACQEIRNGKISREDGVALVGKYDQEFPVSFFPDFLEYLDLSESSFVKIINEFRTPHIWEKKSGEWALRKNVE